MLIFIICVKLRKYYRIFIFFIRVVSGLVYYLFHGVLVLYFIGLVESKIFEIYTFYLGFCMTTGSYCFKIGSLLFINWILPSTFVFCCPTQSAELGFEGCLKA